MAQDRNRSELTKAPPSIRPRPFHPSRTYFLQRPKRANFHFNFHFNFDLFLGRFFLLKMIDHMPNQLLCLPLSLIGLGH